jgi:hypothetical protein
MLVAVIAILHVLNNHVIAVRFITGDSGKMG